MDEDHVDETWIEIDQTEPQEDFYSRTCRYPLFVGGFGSGKTEAMVHSGVMDLVNNPGALIGMYSTTYDLLKINIVPRVQQRLEMLGFRHKFNNQTSIMDVPGLGGFVFRSMTNPERIISYEVFRSHIDELDTLRVDKAEMAWNKILGRNRQKLKSGNDNRVSAYTTPEGFGFTHKKWAKTDNPEYEYVKAPTWSNPFLPDSYVQSLRDTYPEQLVTAYIDGNWCNLSSGSVYYAFDREKCHCSTEPKIHGNDLDHIYIFADFNVYDECATVAVMRKDEIHVVNELFGLRDTPDLIETIKNIYPNNKIFVFPDSTGKNASSKGASLSDLQLLRSARFIIRAKSTNPFIKDRVMAVNKAIESGLLKVNTKKCPELTDCLEQQPYNERTGLPLKDGYFDNRVDGLGYGVNFIYPVVKPTLHQVALGGT